MRTATCTALPCALPLPHAQYHMRACGNGSACGRSVIAVHVAVAVQCMWQCSEVHVAVHVTVQCMWQCSEVHVAVHVTVAVQCMWQCMWQCSAVHALSLPHALPPFLSLGVGAHYDISGVAERHRLLRAHNLQTKRKGFSSVRETVNTDEMVVIACAAAADGVNES